MSDQQILDILNTRLDDWFDGEVWVTDDVSYTMREVIKRNRKNYLGEFDDGETPTGQKKYWKPITRQFTDIFIRNVDIDTKDVNTRAKRKNSHGIAALARFALRHHLYKMDFARQMNDFITRLCIDGTCVTKSLESTEGETLIDSKNVDLLNFITDPTAQNLHESEANIEIHEMDADDYMAHENWKNKKKLLKQIPEDQARIPRIRVYEMWGKIPAEFLDGEKGDWKEGVVIASELADRQIKKNSVESVATNDWEAPQVVNKVMENPNNGRRPYEEGWFLKFPWRWHGVGVPEIMQELQELDNENWNIRFQNARILKNGIFKVRRGSGITQRMLSRLSAGGAVTVKRMDDIEQMAVQDYRQSSYEDEDRIFSNAQRILGASQAASGGEDLPASTPATIGLLNQQNASTTFDAVIENIGDWGRRTIRKHWMPIIFDNMSSSEIVELTGNKGELDNIFQKWAQLKAAKATAKAASKGTVASKETVRQLQESLQGAIEEKPFAEIRKEALDTDLDVQIFLTNEPFDKQTVVSQLRQVLVEMSQIPGMTLDMNELGKEILDLLGVGSQRFFTSEPVQEPANVSQRAQELPTDRTVNQQQEQRDRAGTPPQAQRRTNQAQSQQRITNQ